jgi:HEPN domain-containing protein
MANTPKDWRYLADLDLNTAEHLVKTMRPAPLEIICFHCQQSAEKYLKGFLSMKGEDPPYIHDLDELCKRCEKYEPLFSNIATECTILTQFGVQPRYDTLIQITETDMLQSLKYTQAIKSFLQNIVPEFFDSPLTLSL